MPSTTARTHHLTKNEKIKVDFEQRHGVEYANNVHTRLEIHQTRVNLLTKGLKGKPNAPNQFLLALTNACILQHKKTMGYVSPHVKVDLPALSTLEALNAARDDGQTYDWFSYRQDDLDRLHAEAVELSTQTHNEDKQ